MSVTEILCAIAKQPRETSPVPPAVFDINGECECEWCTRGAPLHPLFCVVGLFLPFPLRAHLPRGGSVSSFFFFF